MSQIVDTESAKEFMQETLSRITLEGLSQISADLQVKNRAFAKMLHLNAIDKLSEVEIHRLLQLVFATRRKTKKILETFSIEKLRKWIKELLYGSEEIAVRFQHFFDRLEGFDNNLRFGLAGELLHFTFPEKYWLWSRWMWDPKTKTGALPLVCMEDFDLNAPSFGEAYMKVGKATAFVHHTGEAAGFQNISRSLFGTDVYLCCVYVIYVYTVLRMRMTQEFNKVIPGLPEFCRRLLGILKMEEYESLDSEQSSIAQ